MNQPQALRIDKWLWAVRLFKTRSLATEQCSKGKIQVNGQAVKPSRTVVINDIVVIKRTGFTQTVKVLQLTANRLGAKLVTEYLIDLTPQQELDNYLLRFKRNSGYREPGTGRPTKRERRDLDDFTANSSDS